MTLVKEGNGLAPKSKELAHIIAKKGDVVRDDE